MQHAGGTDPELLYFFRKALNKLRQKPSIVDNNNNSNTPRKVPVYIARAYTNNNTHPTAHSPLPIDRKILPMHRSSSL